jgi:hypothetical protein
MNFILSGRRGQIARAEGITVAMNTDEYKAAAAK